ncbi:alpha/beta-hydrolase [Tilletiaria anomala UBC 951]|uniref:Carboxypeptidase n=1 Tax=Tilletiaria anomala (strain ATCC 24038 / CBS 436.72 / UBC 951) TaxID=1037660 RepID=A0A066W2I8_TILAU|nr:alpha/beta-hydrolase [Tilletiaria anomala UBC 951]KDN45289.1 alpha/beta-hydrolase [Tilletiaria anomala UBC 951]
MHILSNLLVVTTAASGLALTAAAPSHPPYSAASRPGPLQQLSAPSPPSSLHLASAPGAASSSVNGALSFSSPQAKQYYVGNSYPTVPFPVPESWAGLMPISQDSQSLKRFFFWLYPAQDESNDFAIWLNGGPGCSSLEGLLQENGPLSFAWNVSGFPDQPYVQRNPYSWTNLTNMLWVEQPVSTGFGTGTPDAKDENDVADEFYGFLTNFMATFPELKGKNLYITGESYAGKYIPYIASNIYGRSAEENAANGLNLKGIAINDPSFTGNFFGEEAASIEFAKRWQDDLRLSDGFIKALDADAAKHNFTNFVEKNLVYPPPKDGIQIPKAYAADDNYDPWGTIYDQATRLNKNFNVYNVAMSYYTKDSLGYPPAQYTASSKNILNDIQGFKELIHAPNKTWLECTAGPVFPTGDASPAPDVSVLPGVIEKSMRTVIQHGSQDFILLSQGSQLAIQNMTWNGARGFQSKPSATLIVNGKSAGTYHAERGLTFIEVEGSGHMIPQDRPATAFKNMQYLLGQIDLDQLGKSAQGIL